MISYLNDAVWNGLIYVLIGVGLSFTLASRFVQIRYFFRMFSALKSPKDQKGISSWQALTLSVGGRVGSGNVTGVALAIALGGPGAVFWMWVIGLVGMATSFLECTLAQVYKRKEGENFRGGPAHYIKHGLGKKWLWLAVIYSVLLLVSFGVGFNCLQSYSIATSLEQAFGITQSVTGFILAAIVGVIIFGGIKRLVKVSEFIVPFMAVSYFLTAMYVVLANITLLPEVFATIVNSAFGLEQTVAGGIGSAILYGAKRGLFSNEAGLGSAPNVAATAVTEHPVSQGLVQSLSVFIDTLILCSCTAAMILLSDVYQAGVSDVTLTQRAMEQHIGSYAGAFVSITLLLFGFTTIIYNYYLGENALDYLVGRRKIIFNSFRVATVGLILWGSMQDLSTVLGFSDLAMGLLAFANLFALILLFKIGLSVLKNYDQQIKQGIQRPRFNSAEFKSLDLDKNAWPEK